VVNLLFVLFVVENVEKKHDIRHFFPAKTAIPCSIPFMEPKILFVPSAFKHGFSEADIRRAVRTRISEALIDEYEDTYAIIGFDSKGNLLEILYNLLDDQTMEVYHAMRYRKSFQKKYGPKGEYHGC
jgi:hypothetical protein